VTSDSLFLREAAYFMARRSSQRQEEGTDSIGVPLDTVPEAKAERKPEVNTVKLRLRQNEFVRGVLCLKDSVHEFSEEEAEHRLKTTEKWSKS